MTKRERIGRSFDDGPPHDWTPQIGERVAAFIGINPAGRCDFEIGEVKERFEIAHFSGNPIISYKVEFPDGTWFQISKNNLRPVKKEPAT